MSLNPDEQLQQRDSPSVLAAGGPASKQFPHSDQHQHSKFQILMYTVVYDPRPPGAINEVMALSTNYVDQHASHLRAQSLSHTL